jgi:hypothetical protein
MVAYGPRASGDQRFARVQRKHGTAATEVTLHVESWQIVAEPSDNFLDRKPEGVAFSPQCVLPPIILVGQLQAGEIRHAIL